LKKIVLAGNAITANILYAYLREDKRYEVAGAVVDDEFLAAGSVEGLKTVGFSRVKEIFAPSAFCVVMAIGYNNLNRTRTAMSAKLKSAGYDIETYLHPDARIYSTNPIGEGSIVLPGVVIEPFVHVGANTVIWSNVTLAHDSRVADNCWVAAGTVVSGQASICQNSFLGVNATVVNSVTVDEYNFVGAGALITKSTKAGAVHLARSAELLRYSSDDYVQYFGT
jgi:sugar O-acyltransferase (sialic acid O-acetyltransferase NeuD family)